MQLKYLLCVFLGGGLGSIFRYLLGYYSKSITQHFPMGTLIANTLGCLLIGVLIGMLNKSSWMKEEMTLLLVVGFCGGLTTFSSFTLELIQLSKTTPTLQPILYGLLSLSLGICAVLVGLWLLR